MCGEAEDRDSLALAIQGLKIRIARRLNREWRGAVRVWQDRYHLSFARGPRAIERVLRYVFENYRRHRNADWRNPRDLRDWPDASQPDPLTSVRYLSPNIVVTGVSRPEPEPDVDDWPVVPPQSSGLASVPSLKLNLGSYDSRTIRAARAAALMPA